MTLPLWRPPPPTPPPPAEQGDPAAIPSLPSCGRPPRLEDTHDPSSLPGAHPPPGSPCRGLASVPNSPLGPSRLLGPAGVASFLGPGPSRHWPVRARLADACALLCWPARLRFQIFSEACLGLFYNRTHAPLRLVSARPWGRQPSRGGWLLTSRLCFYRDALWAARSLRDTPHRREGPTDPPTSDGSPDSSLPRLSAGAAADRAAFSLRGLLQMALGKATGNPK